MKKTAAKTVKGQSGRTVKGSAKGAKPVKKSAPVVKSKCAKKAPKPAIKAKGKPQPKPVAKSKATKPKVVAKAAKAVVTRKPVAKPAAAKAVKAKAKTSAPAKKAAVKTVAKAVPAKVVRPVKSLSAVKTAAIKKQKVKEVAIVKPKAVEQKTKTAAPVHQHPAAAPGTAKRPKLKAEDLRKLRDALEQERRRLVEEIRALDDQALTDGFEETMGQQPGFSLQLADSASDNQQVDTALGIRSIEAEQLAQIDEALRAIEMGEYGVCHRCHEAIHLDRLLVKPMARYCVPCLRLLETGKA